MSNILYTMEGNSQSKLAKGFLCEKGIEFTEVCLPNQLEELPKMHGIKYLPAMNVEEKILNGYNAIKAHFGNS